MVKKTNNLADANIVKSAHNTNVYPRWV